MKKIIIKIASSRIFLVLAMILYKLLLDLSFIYYIAPKFAYEGYYIEINLYKLIESYLLLFLLSFIFKRNISKPSEFFILFFFSILIVPMLSIYSLQDKSREYLYMVLLSFMTIAITSKITQIKIPLIHNGRRIAVVISVLTSLFLFSWIIMRGGLSYLNFNLLKVYDFRRTIGEVVFPGKMGYLMIWFGKVINPSMIAFSLWKNNKIMIALTVVLQIMFFGITAHKAMLFYPILIVFTYMFGQKKYFGQMIPFGLASVIIVSSIYYLISGNFILLTLFVRRAIFVAPINHFKYYDTFRELGFVYFSNKTWFPKIIEYPFDLPIPQLISLIYHGHENAWINTGFLATGYMNVGLVGMLVYSVIVGVVFRFIDYISKWYLPNWLCIGIMITPIFSLASSDLLTALITHGILLSMIILWLMSSSNDEKKLTKKNGI